jgi:activator of HSP90 ATPase
VIGRRFCDVLDRTGRGASLDRARWRQRASGAMNFEERLNQCEGSTMQTKTIQQTVTFKASPQEVYDVLMNSKKHRSLSGESAKISKKVGGKFTAWSGHLSGINLVLKPGKKIVQAWRATGWWPDHYSIAIFDITKVRGGSKLKFTQIGIPPNRYSGHYRGWIEAYWTPMKEIFGRGAISDRTRGRVKINREKRIRAGKFRRKISGAA